MEEKRIIVRLKELLGEEEVEYALTNLTEIARRKYWEEKKLAAKQYVEACRLIVELFSPSDEEEKECRSEKRIIVRLKELLGEEEVEYALTLECRNAYLAGVADRLRFDEHKLSIPQHIEACRLIQQLGPDKYEKEMKEKLGKDVNSVEEARKMWNMHGR